MTVRLAFSPCPNDTFVFHALVHGLVPGVPPVEVTYADVDVTNTAAERGAYDVVKVSFAAVPWLLDRYRLLPCGGALGRGCGPLVLTAGRSGGGLGAGDGVAGATVAVPGDRTTAYLLLRLWSADAPPARVQVMPFDQIMPAVRDGRVDAGLVIHEARFTYPSYGLRAIVDLGGWWEAETGLPIPLGAVLARRDLERACGVTPARMAELVTASVRAGWADPAASRDYVLGHAQELSPQVVDAHIGLYVNDFTAELGEAGYAAAEALLGRAVAAGLVPPVGSMRD